ncbi:MAG: LPS export ABC transporter ATP-binding protein [Candidatus Schekmanbacteria bacterium]|nr:LPS export ABC transporter ATP-binding protein [Candidatus Schekmanbacteria bacterium]
MRLETTDLVKRYRKRTVVDRVSISVQPGEVVGLLGPNGAGKTTTFYMVVGLVKPDSGHILLDGEEMTSLPMYRRARRGIGYLTQETSIFRGLTVEQNISAVLETLAISRRERMERLEILLGEFQIARLRTNKAYTLSGGESRRVEIARALASTPSFMLLDEPFAGIDPIAVADIQTIIRGLKERGIGILLTDHNVQHTLETTDRAYVINAGQILAEGTPHELAGNATVRRFYLGEKFQLQKT